MAAPGRRVRAVLGLSVALVACAGAQALRPDEATLARIEPLVATAPCDADDQCRVAGLGSRPCGGPERHVPWSVARTDGRVLAELTERYAEQRRALHEATGRLGTCSILPEPGSRCERPAQGGAGRCVLVPGGGAAAR
jgi:hypothetical protein